MVLCVANVCVRQDEAHSYNLSPNGSYEPLSVT